MSGISGIDDDVGDELCPLCFEQMEPLTFRLKGRTRVVCCGKFICNSCAVKVREHEHEASARFCSGAVGIAQSLRELKQSGACPFCRAQFPRTPKETLQKVLENAKQGHAWAQYTAGIMYTKGEGAPDGVNLSEARSWFEKAAKQGHSLAMCYYGVRLLEDLKDVFQAKVWYEKSIQVDVNPEACVLLGKLLHHGAGGIPSDPREAFRLFQLAADQGFDRGQCLVGVCYKMGPDGGGVPSCDMEKYLYWCLKAAEQGEDCTAMRNVGCHLLITARDKYGGIDQVGKCPIPQALFWFHKGAALGDQTCQGMMVELERIISIKCANCSLPNDMTRKRLIRCVRCKAVCYCGSDCQKMHWKAGHKIDCYISSKK